MIRTTISICALLASLVLLLFLLRESGAQEPAPPPPSDAGPALASPRVAALPEASAQRLPTEAHVGDDEADATAGSDEADAPAPGDNGPSELENPADLAANPLRPEEEPAPKGEEAAPDEAAEPSAEIPLSPRMMELKARVRRCLLHYYRRPENAGSRSPWGVMHAQIAYGVDTQIFAANRRYNAIGYLCFNGPCRGMRLLHLSGGKLAVRNGPGYQGHDGQFLAMIAQARVPQDYPLKVEGREFTVADLIEYEKRTCRPRTELTFKLIGLTHYLPVDTEWKSDDGETWSIPRLIHEELAQPIIGAACGGTHRMMGFSYAVKKRRKSGEPMTGEWERARNYVADYVDYAFKLQNPDGSFSTEWFERRAAAHDIDRRVQTTGHILEWLVYTVEDEELQAERTILSVNYLTELLWQNQSHKWEVGPKGHALHALALYNQRVFGAKVGSGFARFDAGGTEPAAR